MDTPFLPSTGCMARTRTYSCCLAIYNKILKNRATMALLIQMMMPISGMVGVRTMHRLIHWIHWPTLSRS